MITFGTAPAGEETARNERSKAGEENTKKVRRRVRSDVGSSESGTLRNDDRRARSGRIYACQAVLVPYHALTAEREKGVGCNYALRTG